MLAKHLGSPFPGGLLRKRGWVFSSEIFKNEKLWQIPRSYWNVSSRVHSEEGLILKQLIISRHMLFFLHSSLKGTAKALAVAVLRLNTLRSIKTVF